ncbi:nucleocapsid protein [Xapuri virus]|uniref:Nucleoprotein n=1 Tax=Xapuri virus TaxID=2267561 RepID=A0A2Z5DEG4_9VIRU|nr:nucleocapsid protein [Xapuri virus]AXB49216.1 nucleocapsid protein [Xapuri virus]
MALSKEVPSFRWTQALRRGLSEFTTATKIDVMKDAKSLIDHLDFSQVAQVQRVMRKTKRSESDLEKLINLNRDVHNLMSMKTTQSNVVLSLSDLQKDELMDLSADLDKLKKKVTTTERGSPGIYQGNLTQQQLEKRTDLLRSLGFSKQGRSDTVVRVWDINDSNKLVNQFGSIPALTIACMTVQGDTSMNDVIQGLSSLGLLYTVKYPNLKDLEKLTNEHDCLEIITKEESSNNISGFNFSLSAAVKAGASIIDGGNMLETIRVSPDIMTQIIKSLLIVKRKEGMFVDPRPGQRNPYENILYKLCLSGEGWPYISSRTQIKGRAWDNTTVDIQKGSMGPSSPVKNGGSLTLSPITSMQEAVIKEAIQKLDVGSSTWIDIEGAPTDPVELAIYQPDSGAYIHCFRKPHDEKGFKTGSKYSHGILLKDIEEAQPGLMSKIITMLPRNMVLTAQGTDDIKKFLELHGRRDLILVDVSMTSEQARHYEDRILDEYSHLCTRHNGVVIVKKKKNHGHSGEPHCALMDCLMYQCSLDGHMPRVKPKALLPPKLLFREKPSFTL